MTKTSFRFSMMLALAAAISLHGQSVLANKTCGEYGTSLTFSDSPAEAAKQALQQEKLVFVLHVSGLFEESDYT